MRASPSGSANSCNRRQEHAKAAIMPGPRGSKRALAMVCGAGWSPATEPKKLRPGSSHAEAPQHSVRCAGPAVQLDAKAASKTAASGHEGPNVPLATPPRRPLAPPPNRPCSSATLVAAETALKPSTWTCLTRLPQAECSSAVLQMFTLGPLSRAGNVLTVPYPQKCSDSVLTAF